MDDFIGPGTHWVCYYNNYYFDPFGMPLPLEVKKYINNIKYNDIQYQDIKSVLCGYYYLYFLKRLNDRLKESTDSSNPSVYKIYDILYEDFVSTLGVFH